MKVSKIPLANGVYTDEKDRALEASLKALKLWEKWEADIISNRKCWSYSEFSTTPLLTDNQWNTMIEKLQPARNNAVNLIKSISNVL